MSPVPPRGKIINIHKGTIMRLSQRGAADVRLHEGFVDHWYLDAVKVPTIGIGFTWGSSAFRDWWTKYRPGQPFARGATMTKAEADTCLIHLCDLEYGAAVVKFLAGQAVQQHVFDAMVSMVFNCGPGALKWNWAKEILAGDLKHAATLLRKTAITARGVKLAGLVKRREDEANLLLNGVYRSGAPSLPAASDAAMADGMLVRGERGDSVKRLQLDLLRHGYAPGKPDGVFGFGTEAAVLDFQKRSGLTVDGKAGARTLSRLAA